MYGAAAQEAEAAATWVCEMNPDAAHNDCSAPQEEDSDDEAYQQGAAALGGGGGGDTLVATQPGIPVEFRPLLEFQAGR